MTQRLMMIGLFIGIVSMSQAAEKKCVGIFNDRRSCGVEGVAITLEKEGYSTKVISKKDIQDAANLEDIDVIYLSGGWNGIDFAGFNGRKNLVDFVAQGKGILAGAFRSGWFRTANRPLFPQVGYTFFKSNAMYIFPKGDSPLVEGVDRPCFVANWDTMQARVGANGKVFAVDVAGKPVGVYGDVYGGRYVILGDFIHMSKDEMPDTLRRRLFLNCVKWLAESPELTQEAVDTNRRIAEEDFLRCDLLYDWLHDDTGPDNGPGILPELKYSREMPLYSRLWQLEYLVSCLPESGCVPLETSMRVLKEGIAKLNRNYHKLAARRRMAIESMSLEQLREEHVLTRDVEKNRKAVDSLKDEERKKQLTRAIARNNLQQKQLISLSEGDRIRNEMMSQSEVDSMTSDADKLIQQAMPKAVVAREKLFELERKRDLKNVPELIARLSSQDVEVRINAIRELGRIGDRKAAPELIKLLAVDDEDVLVNTIQALAWMQEKKAVPELMKLLKSDSVRVRRRAAQALGQIGDDKAVKPLLESLNDDDFHVRQNAVFALGWLKAADAVQPLMDLIRDGDREDPYQRDLMISAVRALGHIGDKRALPILEELAANAADFPGAARWRGPRHTNIYAIGTTLGLQGHAELAIKETGTGGLAGKGIKQPEYLSRKDKFSPFRDNFNFLAGRPFCGTYQRYFDNDIEGVFAFVKSLGGNGVHCAWDISRDRFAPDDYREMLLKAGNYDLKWIDTMPSVNNGVFHAQKHKIYKNNGSLLCKSTAENTILAYEDVPAFQGFWFEECWPPVLASDTDIKRKLKGFLLKKYGADYKKMFGWNGDEELKEPTIESSPEQCKLWAAFLEVAGDSTIDEWRESQEWLHGLRKGCAFTYNESVSHLSGYIGNFSRAGSVISAFGPESYLSFDPNSTLAMELSKDGEARPVLCEFYNWYDQSDRHSEIGFAKQLMHGECFFNFDLAQLSKAPAVYMYYYKKNLQKICGNIFRKAEEVKEFLAGAGSAANVAVLASERSRVLFYSLKVNETVTISRRYDQQLLAFWDALRQLGVPADAIWAETMTQEKLARYRVLLLPDGKSLTVEQEDTLRKWVEKGGILIATGSTSVFDENGIQQQNYGLSDVFGVDYARLGSVKNPEEIDTYCFVKGEQPIKVSDEGYNREKILRAIHREVKPTKSAKPCQVVEPSPFLPGIAECSAFEYDMPLGYDKVSGTSAKVLAEFEDGSPALTVNEFGKGLCYFWTPVYPGLCHTLGDIVYTPCVYKFWPGVRDMLGAMIAGGLQYAGDSLPVRIGTGPVESLEVVARNQPDQRRWIIHLLNCNTSLDVVKGVNLTVKPPETEKVRVFYPDTKEDVSFVRSAGGVAFGVRDFKVHEMIVVEY